MFNYSPPTPQKKILPFMAYNAEKYSREGDSNWRWNRTGVQTFETRTSRRRVRRNMAQPNLDY
jgi:hypothetical protein